jgi:ATP-dependent DNA helicase HFM1/MER3
LKLSALAQAHEFKEFKFRSGERSDYKELNTNPMIKFPIPVHLDLPAHKVSLIIQSALSGIEPALKNSNLEYKMERQMILNQLKRLIRCIIDFEIHKQDAIALRNSLMILRSVCSEGWDNTALQMKQIESIGNSGVHNLVNAGITSIEALEATEPHKIESALKRNPPFGRKILDSLTSFPKLRVSVKMIGRAVS